MNTAEKLEPQTTELTLPERSAVALSSSKTEAELKALVDACKAITAVTNKAGREECHASLMRLKGARTAIQKTGKDARDDANKFSKAIIAEENRLVALVSSEEDRLQVLRDKWDAEREAEKEAERQKEAARVAAIRERIAGIRSVLKLVAGATSETMGNAIRELKAVAIDDTYAEFKDEAQHAKTEVMGELVLAQNAAVKREKEAADKAEADRIERERIAEERAENERVQADLKRQADELRAEREEEERKRQAEREEFARRQQEEQDRIASDRKRLDEERAELDRKRAEIEAAQNPAPIDAPEDGETFPVVGTFDVVGDVFPPEIEADEILQIVNDELDGSLLDDHDEDFGEEEEDESESPKLSALTRASLDLHRAWCAGCIARAPTVGCDDTRAMIHGVCQTLRDEIAAIDSIIDAAA